jgi:hypothetical protein
VGFEMKLNFDNWPGIFKAPAWVIFSCVVFVALTLILLLWFVLPQDTWERIADKWFQAYLKFDRAPGKK